MPIYEFDCSACGHDFERLQKMSDPDPVVCPVCGKDTVKRRLSAPSFRLAGSGWYETDFKTDKDKKRNLAGAEDGGSKSSGGDTSKPAETAKSSTSDGSSTPAAKPAAPASSPASTSSSSSST